jgi:hypothetical protein
MIVAALDPHAVGMASGAAMIPLIGLILLIVGLVVRTRSQKQPPPMPSPGYPGQPPIAQSQSPYPPPPPAGYGPTRRKRRMSSRPFRRRAGRRIRRRPAIGHRHVRSRVARG